MADGGDKELFVCLYASARQHSIALTEMRHESPKAFARLRNKTTRDNRTEIKITANPLGLLQNMEQNEHRGEGKHDVIKELTCVIGPIHDRGIALKIKQQWEGKSRGTHPRCVTACLLARQYNVPVRINWHAFYQMDPLEVTIIEEVDPDSSRVTKLTHFIHDNASHS